MCEQYRVESEKKKSVNFSAMYMRQYTLQYTLQFMLHPTVKPHTHISKRFSPLDTGHYLLCVNTS